MQRDVEPCSPGDLLHELPPIKGGEYWGEEAAAGVFRELIELLRRRLALSPLQTVAECIRSWNPQWQHWGKFIFHLAENKDATTSKEPFAFMATYLDTMEDGREKHWPLASALKWRRENQAGFQ